MIKGFPALSGEWAIEHKIHYAYYMRSVDCKREKND